MRKSRHTHLFRLCLSVISLLALLIVVVSDTTVSSAIRSSATSSTATQLPANGKIAFTSERDGNPEIYSINPDGTDTRRLTFNPGADDYPAWSSDGLKIAYLSESSSGQHAIKIMNADGSGQQIVTPVVFNLSTPNFCGERFSLDWSPDDSKIVFQEFGHIVTVNVDGTSRQNITNTSERESEPSWALTGLMAYASTLDRGDGINGLDLQTTDGYFYAWYGYFTCSTSPDLSTDGTKLAYVHSNDFPPPGYITILPVDFHSFEERIFNFVGVMNVRWSPDANYLVFTSSLQYPTLNVEIVDQFGQGRRALTQGSNPSWQTLVSADPNPIDRGDFFVRQQYLDFLEREPEPAGLQFYLDILNGCHPADTECVKYTRGALSANFFRSPEFERKGAYVANLFNIVIGQRPKTVAELNDATKVERPHYAEFMADLATLSTPNDDPVLTDQKKDQLASAWLVRTEVQAILPSSLSNQQFVQKLESIAGVTLANESTLIANLNNGSQTRAQVLRAIAESNEVVTKFYIPNFVTMEYLGYLRRDPEDCHFSSDPESCGFIFHNRRFNTPGADPDLIENIIVRGFIESPEYRSRFGP